MIDSESEKNTASRFTTMQKMSVCLVENQKEAIKCYINKMAISYFGDMFAVLTFNRKVRACYRKLA